MPLLTGLTGLTKVKIYTNIGSCANHAIALTQGHFAPPGSGASRDLPRGGDDNDFRDGGARRGGLQWRTDRPHPRRQRLDVDR